MPLHFSGESGSTKTFEKLLESFDGTTRVVVVTSREAIDDYGLAAVQSKASEKYDARQLDAAGRVRVVTTDF